MKITKKPLVAALGLLMLVGCNSETPVVENPTASAKIELTETIYVPGKDDKLHPKSASFKAIETQTRMMGNAAPVLQEIIQAAPEYFPKGTKVNDFKSDEKQITIDLNAAFAQNDFWSKNGEKTTEVAIYSLVNSASGKSKKPVEITIEGKPASTLGEFDIAGAIEPSSEIVAEK
jgi:uncharacterized phage protein gp47/JayE